MPPPDMLVVPQASHLQSGPQRVAVALGMFDGVHLGHQAVLQQALMDGRPDAGLTVALTFDQHPNTILAPDRAPPLVYTLSHRLQVLEAQGLDAAIVIPFDKGFSQVRAEAFVRDLARSVPALLSLSVGIGFCFGHQREGDVALLRALGKAIGFKVHAVPPVTHSKQPISSTRIRDCIRQGDLASASRLLGRPYSIRSRVVKGDRIGQTLGFPTANLDIRQLVLPPSGVYAAHAVLDHRPLPAVLNLGHRPTLNQPHPEARCEVHLLDFEGDLYDQELEAVFVSHLRDERRFASIEALRNEIERDVATARDRLSAASPSAD